MATMLDAPPAPPPMRLWRDAALGPRGVDMLVAQRATHRYAPHIHGEFVLAVIEAGAQRNRIAGREAVALPGTLVLIAPGLPHGGEAAFEDGQWSHRAFYPDAETLAEAADALFAGPLPASLGFGEPLVMDPDLAHGFVAAHHAVEAAAGDPLRRQEAFAAVVAGVLRRHLKPRRGDRSADPRRAAMARAIACMESRFDEPGLEVAALAAAAGLSAFHFMRSFRAATGMTAHAYLVQVRLRAALAALSRGGSAAEVAAGCGFADQSHLIRHFRAAYGVTPGRYARETRRRLVVLSRPGAAPPRHGPR